MRLDRSVLTAEADFSGIRAGEPDPGLTIEETIVGRVGLCAVVGAEAAFELKLGAVAVAQVFDASEADAAAQIGAITTVRLNGPRRA